ncbi:MAG: glycosyltransferase family 2 protein [Simkaniaceae bacterium]|nr:glycosyltransferase family 2 protein [Candidatus Sacchlamyda saccharinae]
MITATVLTKNAEKTIKKTLDSLKSFAEVIVLDSGSTDDTLTIAKTYPNVQVHTSPFLGFGPMHNYGAKLAHYDWILSIDADEELTDELTSEIQSTQLDPEKIYRIQRHNYFNGKHIKWCGGWHPDFVTRLYHRKKTSFSEDLVHEKVEVNDLQIETFKNPLKHTPYLEMSDFLNKMQHYSTLFAEQNHGQEGSIFEALLHSWFAFIKSFIFKRGFLGGKEGFIISMYNGHTTFYKYLKLAEKLD